MNNLEKVVERLNEEVTTEELIEMVRDCISYDGSFEDLDWQENDEEFFNIYFEGKVDEAVRAVCYGDYNYTDEYVKFNAYGNLESASQYEIEQDIEDQKEEIIEHYIELYDCNNVYPSRELQGKIEEIIEETEEEE